MSEYPEHDKLSAVQDQSQAIGDFLANGGYVLCEYTDESDYPLPVQKSIQRLLAEWFDIDLDKLEREKRAMLEALRA
jgi:hypothetical protein